MSGSPYRRSGERDRPRIGRFLLVEPLRPSRAGARWIGKLDVAASPTPFHVLLVADEIAAASGAEARVARSLRAASVDDPRVESVFDVGAGEATFVVSGFVAGHRLRSLAVARGGALSPAVAAHAVAEAALGAHAIHAAGGAHGAITPERVLVTYAGGGVLVGYATTAFEEAAPTTAAVLRDELRYRAPEVLRGGPKTPYADVYALGVVLWELLADAPLFARSSATKTLAAALAGDVAPPSKHRHEVPRALDDLALAALAPTPAARPDARTLAQALRRAGGRSEAAERGELGAAVLDALGASRAALAARLAASGVVL